MQQTYSYSIKQICTLSHSLKLKKYNVHQHSPLLLQANSLLCWCLFLYFFFPLFSFLCRPISLLFNLMFYFSFSSISLPHFSPPFPGAALFPFSGLLVTFAPWPFCTAGHLCFVTAPADVAHHRAQHAVNKPSNPKTPQGTILSAPYCALLSAHPVDAIRRQNLPKLSLPSCCN